MKQMNWLLGFAFVMMFSFAASAQQVSGVMMVVKGDIKVTAKDGKTEAAKVGKKVTEGDTIMAGADSRAKVVMSDKNVINVSPDSKIVIEKYENDGKDKKNVELNVVYGKVRASVEQKYDGEKNKFNVKTPSAVAGVRGTDFLAGYNPSTKSTQVITFSGSVAVGTPGPGGKILNPVFVRPGQMTQVGAGQAPEAPKSVPAEDLNKMNSETKADAPSSAKQDSPETTGEAKKEEKKEDSPQEEKKETTAEKKEDKAEKKEDKAADKTEKKEDKQADKGSDKDKSQNKKSDKGPDKSANNRSPGSSANANASGGNEPLPDQSRAPASTPPMTGSMGPETLPSAGSMIAPSVGVAPPVFLPPPPTTYLPPPTNTFIDSAIRNTQKSKTTIILSPQ